MLIKQFFYVQNFCSFYLNCNFLLFVISSSRRERAFDAGIIEPGKNGCKLHRATDYNEHDVISIPPSDVENVSGKLCSIAVFRRSINLIEKLPTFFAQTRERERNEWRKCWRENKYIDKYKIVAKHWKEEISRIALTLSRQPRDYPHFRSLYSPAFALHL